MLLELLSRNLDGDALGKLGSNLGTSKESTQGAVMAALPLFIGALARNASSSDGASALTNAISRDHDGGILNDLTGFLGRADTAKGEGILGHIFGNKRPLVEKAVANAGGMETGNASQLLVKLAPVVMGALGKITRSQGVGGGDLSSLLKQEAKTASSSGAGPLLSLLDRDKDGSVVDDLADIGSRLMGGLFRK